MHEAARIHTRIGKSAIQRTETGGDLFECAHYAFLARDVAFHRQRGVGSSGQRGGRGAVGRWAVDIQHRDTIAARGALQRDRAADARAASGHHDGSDGGVHRTISFNVSAICRLCRALCSGM